MFVVGGESLIDLVSEPRSPGGVIRLNAHPGGSPMNTSIALSRLGNATGFLCPISRDGFGDYILEALDAKGVTVLLGERVVAPTTLAVVTLDQKMNARYEFYRYADHPLEVPAMIAALPDRPSLYQTGGFCPIEPRDAAIWIEVIDEAARRGAVISIDANVRPSLINDFDGYRTRLGHFFERAHLIKMSDEDMRALRPDLDIEAHGALLLAQPRAELVVVTLGEHGSLAWSKAGHARAPIWSPPVFGDTVGAGDTLMAGVLTWLEDNGRLRAGALAGLDDAALGQMLRFGAVAAGLNCGHRGCVPPTRPEVDAVLARG